MVLGTLVAFGPLVVALFAWAVCMRWTINISKGD